MNLRMILAGAALFIVTLALYWPARNYAFLNLDDPQNVMRNRMVINGLTPAGIAHAFTTHSPDYWRPLTWVSFMIDSELYGVEPFNSRIVPATRCGRSDTASLPTGCRPATATRRSPP